MRIEDRDFRRNRESFVSIANVSGLEVSAADGGVGAGGVRVVGGVEGSVADKVPIKGGVVPLNTLSSNVVSACRSALEGNGQDDGSDQTNKKSNGHGHDKESSGALADANPGLAAD